MHTSAIGKTIQMTIKIYPEKCRGCLSCMLACSFKKYRVFNILKSCIKLKRDVETETYTPIIDEDCCDLCSGEPECVNACPYDALIFTPVGGD